MNQMLIGEYIQRKRKEKNLTQAQLAENLGVSNKTISKWENGKCMPDYNVIQNLCKELDITMSELMDGENAEKDSIRIYDDEQILELLKRTNELEKQKNITQCCLMIILGISLNAMALNLNGSNAKDFLSGFLTGIGIILILLGIYMSLKHKK